MPLVSDVNNMQDIEAGVDMAQAAAGINEREGIDDREVFGMDEKGEVGDYLFSHEMNENRPDYSDDFDEKNSEKAPWIFTSSESQDMALYGSQEVLKEYIERLRKQISGASAKTYLPDQIKQMIQDESSLKRIYQARRLLDVKHLNRTERLKYNGLEAGDPLKKADLEVLADKVFMIYKDAGAFHGLKQDEAEFRNHILGNLEYMNTHGMQGMLKKAKVQYENPKKYARIVEEMHRNASDVNYSDRIVAEREMTEMMTAAAGSDQNPVRNRSVESEVKVRKVPVFDENTSKFISMDELYTRLQRQVEKLDGLEKTLREMKPLKGETIEKTVERAAKKNDLKAKSWIENNGRDVRVLVGIDVMKQMELKVAGKSAEQVADQVGKIRNEYVKRMDLLKGYSVDKTLKRTVEHRQGLKQRGL